jgi:hypothetical protein
MRADEWWCPNPTPRNLCVLCVSAVYLFCPMLTAETQRTQSSAEKNLQIRTPPGRILQLRSAAQNEQAATKKQKPDYAKLSSVEGDRKARDEPRVRWKKLLAAV